MNDDEDLLEALAKTNIEITELYYHFLNKSNKFETVINFYVFKQQKTWNKNQTTIRNYSYAEDEMVFEILLNRWTQQ